MDNKRMVGLTLGKYAPLTKGHTYVFDEALKQCDKLIVIVYDAPSTISIPLIKRANWIRKLYPQVEVINGYCSPEITGNTDSIKSLHEQFVKYKLGGQKVDKFFSSEFYGKHMSESLGAKNVIIDRDRTEVPISATKVRSNPLKFKQFIDPVVYRDLINHNVFVGAPSTGKTTLCSMLANEYDTVWQPEYGREYWAKNQIDRRLTLEQLVEIAEGHIEREESSLQHANKFLFTDTNAITTYLFSKYYHGEVHSDLQLMAIKANTRYDHVFLCDTDIPYDDTWDRSGDANRQEFQSWFVDEMYMREIPFTLVSGTIKQRIQIVKNVLSK